MSEQHVSRWSLRVVWAQWAGEATPNLTGSMRTRGRCNTAQPKAGRLTTGALVTDAGERSLTYSSPGMTEPRRTSQKRYC